MTDSVSRQQLPVPLAYRHQDRAQILAALIGELTRGDPARNRLNLATRSPSDPTVALLDGWATIADVIDFYQERIATESYLDTATEPESVLALAQLLGYRPRPGLAATCWLAYTLVPDLTDTAVLIPKNQLVQSIPGPGEQPQTFETSEDLVARPSWNTLPVKTTAPLQIVKDGTDTDAPDHYLSPPELLISGTAPQVGPADIILITPADRHDRRVILRVRDVHADLMSNRTKITVQQPDTGVEFLERERVAEGDLVDAIGNLEPFLKKAPSTPPPNPSAVPPNPNDVFRTTRSPVVTDFSAKVLTALNPGLSAALYPALASTAIGTPQIEAVDALRVSTAPYGVQIPPRPRFDRHGQQQPAEEWPIDATQTVRIVLADNQPDAVAVTTAAIHLEGPSGAGNARINDGTPQPATVANIDINVHTDTGTIDFAPRAGEAAVEHLSVQFDSQEMTVTVTNAASGATASVSLADARLAAASVAGLPAPSAASAGLSLRAEVLRDTGLFGAALVREPSTGFVIDIASALPLGDRATLDLSERHDEIVAGSYVMVETPPSTTASTPALAKLNPLPNPQPDEPTYPLVARVRSASAVAVNRYGMSLTVTRLHLDTNWIGRKARLLSDLRALTVHSQSVTLNLLPVPYTVPVADNTITVDGLHPGIETGRRLLLTGARADLPEDATVHTGEAVMVSGITQTSDPGSTPYTTVTFFNNLSYTYRRDSVTLYGNVVPAHHGVTVTETLTATGDPAHPVLTLAQAPVLADPSPGQSGYTSTLRLVIDGRTWTPVSRLDETTPPRCYLTGTDSTGHTTITLSQPLPHTDSTVTATYRAGAGGLGNLKADQLAQPLTRPLAVATVTNPLPASGGADPDGPGAVRVHAPRGLGALGRVVSAQDAADIALSWAGIGKATAATGSDGRPERLTVAGTSPTPLDPEGDLIRDIGAALIAAGGLVVPIDVAPADISLIVLAAQILRDPDLAWDTVERAVRTELTGTYGYDQREIDEDILVSDLLAVIHRVEGVRSATITRVGLIASTVDAGTLAVFSPPSPPKDGRIPVTGVAYISAAVADLVILQEAPG